MYVAMIVLSVIAGIAPEAATKGYPRQVQSILYTASADETQQPAVIYAVRAETKRPLLVGLHIWSSSYDSAGGDAVYACWCIENDWHFIHPHFRGPN